MGWGGGIFQLLSLLFESRREIQDLEMRCCYWAGNCLPKLQANSGEQDDVGSQQQLLSTTSSSGHRWAQAPGWSNQMPSFWNIEKSNRGWEMSGLYSSSWWGPEEISH